MKVTIDAARSGRPEWHSRTDPKSQLLRAKLWSGVTENIWEDDGSLASSSQFDWVYDAAGRLVSETANIAVGLDVIDYRLEWTYDLTGNR